MQILSSTRPGHRPGRPGHRRVGTVRQLVMLGAAALAALLAATTPAVGATTFGQGPSKAKPVVAAFYFGDASPINMWNSDLSGARAAFQQIQQQGFNAVALAVPWSEFQPSVSPVTYNAAAFRRLKSLVATAASLKLQVIIRLSYSVDIDPNDKAPDRFLSVYGSPSVYSAWLAYVSKIHQTVAGYSNVTMGELSWEDFWTPVADAAAATTTASRVQLAKTSGFQSWLRTSYSLTKVSRLYGTTFHSWSAVPTPLSTQPSFSLMYKFDDWAMVNRFFTPAASRFPGLNLEARIDVDPLYNGTAVVGSYSHAATFKLPGTKYIGMYFSPYLGDPSSAKNETAAQGVAALQSTLSSMSARAKRPLYIFEYEIASNSPPVADDPAIPPSQIPAFVAGSEPILKKYTLGYALWTYRDYNLNPLYNPSFSLGTGGWTVTGPVTTSNSASGSSASLGSGASVTQTFATGYLESVDTASITVSFEAASTSGRPTTLRVGLTGDPTQSVTVSSTPQTYTLRFASAPVLAHAPSTQISIAAAGPASITDAQVYNFTQIGDVLNVDGSPAVAAAPLLTLNKSLTGAS